jgi:hypothetical protein
MLSQINKALEMEQKLKKKLKGMKQTLFTFQ